MKCLFLLMTLAFLFGGAGNCGDDLRAIQFNFWIGDWDVYDKDGKHVGQNSIKQILDGCVLQETWAGDGGSAGSSFSHYNPSTGKWQQYWVWKNGTTLPLLGGQYEEGRMVLSATSKTKEGKTIQQRISWYNNDDGTVRHHWEVSKDAGATWVTNFDGTYVRKKK